MRAKWDFQVRCLASLTLLIKANEAKGYLARGSQQSAPLSGGTDKFAFVSLLIPSAARSSLLAAAILLVLVMGPK